MAESITQEQLRELLSYDEGTGRFTYLVSRPRRLSGTSVGSVDARGYCVASIKYRKYKLHRLAWLLSYGVWPSADIDHINGDKTDNRIANLRLSSAKLNKENLRKADTDSKSGLLGVFPAKGGRLKPWKAAIKIEGRARHLGYFASREDAHAAYVDAKRKLHEGCTI